MSENTVSLRNRRKTTNSDETYIKVSARGEATCDHKPSITTGEDSRKKKARTAEETGNDYSEKQDGDINTAMRQLIDTGDKKCDNASKLVGKICDKLEEFKRDVDNLPKDADGIYLIVKGEAKVVNVLNNFELKKIAETDFFGVSKYVQSQGYSYFGDVIAYSPNQTKSPEKIKFANSKSASSNKYPGSGSQNGAQVQVKTTSAPVSVGSLGSKTTESALTSSKTLTSLGGAARSKFALNKDAKNT